MSLKDLTSTHEVDIYPLTQTGGAVGDVVESLGTREVADQKCRVVPLAVKEKHLHDQTALGARYAVLFHKDVELTTRNALVWDSKVWRVREYSNASGVSWLWRAVVEHDPQVEITAP